MVVFLRSQEQARHLDASVAAAARTVQITNDQYSEGEVDFTPVFLFESTLTQQQDQLAVAQGDIALGLIAVYRALGGGWQIRLAGNSPESQVAEFPLLEEMPAPEADESDIQFQSFTAQSVFMKSADDELKLRATAPPIPPAPVALSDTAERESS